MEKQEKSRVRMRWNEITPFLWGGEFTTEAESVGEGQIGRMKKRQRLFEFMFSHEHDAN
jgi:hypothetical protein